MIGQIQSKDHHICAGIFRQILQFAMPVHRIDRHNRRPGAQDTVIGYDVLRAVLHIQQHPVAPLDVNRLQIPGHVFDLITQV